jgi:choline dehydrogenase-like flavoprotein
MTPWPTPRPQLRYQNLWICDNAVFPGSLAANPALAILPLDLRKAATFLKR